MHVVMSLSRWGGVTRQLWGNVEAGGGDLRYGRGTYGRRGAEGIDGYGMGRNLRGHG